MNHILYYLPFIIIIFTYINDFINFLIYRKSTMALKTPDHKYYLLLNQLPLSMFIIYFILTKDTSTLEYSWGVFGIHIILRVIANYFIYRNKEKLAEQKMEEFRNEINKVAQKLKEKENNK